MAFLHDIPLQLEKAVFSGLTTSILSRIGTQRPSKYYAATFEQELLHEDVTSRTSFSGRPFFVRPTSPVRPADWLLGVSQCCCFSMTSVVCGMIYLDRLIKDQRVLFTPATWDLVWICLMILSEKFTEDNFIHPGHILYTAINDQFQMSDRQACVEMQNMQFWLLSALDWRLNIDTQVFDSWVCHLRDLGYQSSPSLQSSSPIFIQRPIPNQKLRRTSHATVSTSTPDDLDLQCHSSTCSTTNYAIGALSDSDFEGQYPHDTVVAAPTNHFHENAFTTDSYYYAQRADMGWISHASYQQKERHMPEDFRFGENDFLTCESGFSQDNRVFGMDQRFSRISHAFSLDRCYSEGSLNLPAERRYSESSLALSVDRRYSEGNLSVSMDGHFREQQCNIHYAPILVQPHNMQVVVTQPSLAFQPVECFRRHHVWAREAIGPVYMHF